MENEKLQKTLKEEYNGIKEILIEDGTLIIFADDDTLWNILKDKRDEYNMEFEAGSGEGNFLRVLV